ncbi:hypothetical protein RchiOBHm_Chr6g0274811 [Rosa chinensis]|uniref:Uncharacterized protein n=1 Tax=Rosa chinensis TaxID=74649 RepID=A0A2P6PRU3_ROSCH|nr:hypothetical protein RchiOBHm_Chr6g0274811 [Rosa chinensis]
MGRVSNSNMNQDEDHFYVLPQIMCILLKPSREEKADYCNHLWKEGECWFIIQYSRELNQVGHPFNTRGIEPI